MPTSASIGGEISPVYAPVGSACIVCANTAIPLPASFSTETSSAVKGTQSATSAGRRGSSGTSSSSRSQYAAASARVPHIFQLAAMNGLRIVQGVEAGQLLALEQLERRSAAGREVVDVGVEPEPGERGGGVAASDDGPAGRSGDRLGEGARAVCEGVQLERAHRAVPEHGPRPSDLLGVGLGGARADVEAHPPVRDVRALLDAPLGLGVEAVAEDQVEREQQLAARALGLLERPPG